MGCSNQDVQTQSEVKTATGILLAYEFDTQVGGWNGPYYMFSVKDDHSTFYYHNPQTGEERRSDFTVERYNDLLSMIIDQPLTEYKDLVDSNGKITYTTVPHLLGLYINPDVGYIYYTNPDNMTQIIEEFEKLRELSDEV